MVEHKRQEITYHAFVRYCDATSYSGNLEGTYKAPHLERLPVHFKGRKILEAVIEMLLKEHHMDEAENFLLTGCSTGDLGVILNADHVHTMQKRKVKAP